MSNVRLRVVAVALAAGTLLAAWALFGDDGGDAPPDRSGGTGAPAEGGDAGVLDASTTGVFVGTARGSGAVVAIVAAPADDEGNRDITAFVSNGHDVSESFAAQSDDGAFRAMSRDDDAELSGTLDGDRASGSLSLAGGTDVAFRAERAAGAAGLYNLTISPKGKLTGATPAGVGATGIATLETRGKGRVQLADGQQLPFEVTRRDTAGPAAGQVLLIVTADGSVVGVGRSPGQADGFRFRSPRT